MINRKVYLVTRREANGLKKAFGINCENNPDYLISDGMPKMKEYKIPENQNICRIFQLPPSYPSGFCFSGGHAVNFQMVDWLGPIHPDLKMKNLKDGYIILTETEYETNKKNMLKFLLYKNYVVTGAKYLCITEYGDCFMFEKTGTETVENIIFV